MQLKKRIILGITGSIAASKCYDLIAKLKKAGSDVKVVLTSSARHFIKIELLSKIINRENLFLAEDLFHGDEMLHIDLAKFAEIILIAPASANFIAKLSAGLADDLLSTICLASNASIIVAPAMNQQMWHNKFTQNNLNNLSRNDIEIIGPAYGIQACGDIGFGRMSEPEQIIEELLNRENMGKSLQGTKVLITAGPTIEPIDSVRYISNYSSGKMGWSLAKVAHKMGADVTIISGPVNLDIPHGVKVEFIKSAQQMFEAVCFHARNSNIFIASAAVADYKPLEFYNKKIKKNDAIINIKLQPTVDILKEIAHSNEHLFTVGFAAETDELLNNARKKLNSKNLDIIIANDVSNGAVFGSDYNQVLIIAKNTADPLIIEKAPKSIVATKILQIIAENYCKKQESSFI